MYENVNMYKKQDTYFLTSYISVSYKPSMTQQNNDKCKKYKPEK